ncbi:hypothetical protein LXL04_003459 [Taraxacum kok-saghyz]
MVVMVEATTMMNDAASDRLTYSGASERWFPDGGVGPTMGLCDQGDGGNVTEEKYKEGSDSKAEDREFIREQFRRNYGKTGLVVKYCCHAGLVRSFYALPEDDRWLAVPPVYLDALPPLRLSGKG